MRKIFVSYHQVDEIEANIWCRRFGSYFREIRTLGLNELDDDLAERINSGDSDYVMRQIRQKKVAGTSCSVVLVGKCTWSRRYVDWEIAATLRDFGESTRGGLIAVQLPGAEQEGWNTLPPRLAMNLSVSEDGTQTGYVRSYGPAPSDGTIAEWVEEAVARRDDIEPVTGSTSSLMVRSRTCD
jgi:hypothetical protein